MSKTLTRPLSGERDYGIQTSFVFRSASTVPWKIMDGFDSKNAVSWHRLEPLNKLCSEQWRPIFLRSSHKHRPFAARRNLKMRLPELYGRYWEAQAVYPFAVPWAVLTFLEERKSISCNLR